MPTSLCPKHGHASVDHATRPVRHGYVQRPEDWAWSSFHRHVRMGWLDPHWPGSTRLEFPVIEE